MSLFNIGERIQKIRSQKDATKTLEEMCENLVANATRGDSVKGLVEFLSRCHPRSFNNMMLIFAQRRSATVVLGKTEWERKGYVVKGGAEPIGVLSPSFLLRSQDSRVKAWLARNPFVVAMEKAKMDGKRIAFSDEELKRVRLCSTALPVKWSTKASLVYPPYKPTQGMIRKMIGAGIVASDFENVWKRWKSDMKNLPYTSIFMNFSASEVYDLSDVEPNPEKKPKRGVKELFSMPEPKFASAEETIEFFKSSLPESVSIVERKIPGDEPFVVNSASDEIVINSDATPEKRALAYVRSVVSLGMNSIVKTGPKSGLAMEMASSVVCEILGMENPYLGALLDIGETDPKELLKDLRVVHKTIIPIVEGIHSAYIYMAEHNIEDHDLVRTTDKEQENDIDFMDFEL